MKPDKAHNSSEASVVAPTAGQLRVTGTVDPDNVLALRAEGERLISASQPGSEAPLTVKLDDLETASSIVLSLLLGWQRLALSEHKPLAFSGVSDRLRSLAALSGLDHHLPGF